MRASRFIAFVTVALGLWPSLVSAQTLERTCLPGDARSQGLDAAVDAAGTLHLSRIDRVFGDLIHTRIAPDGTAVDTVVAAGISRLAVDEVTRTGLALWHDEPAICFRSARIPGLGVATHDAAGWHVRTLVTGADVGRDCALVADATRLRVTYRDADALVAGEVSPGGWAPVTLDRVAGRTVGRDLAALSDATGHLIVAHHDGLGQLRVTWETPGGFQTLVGNPGGVAAGVRPALTLADDGTLVVLHGGLNAQLDSGADVGLYDSRGSLVVPFVTHRLSVDTLGGGQAVLSTANGRGLFARDRQRSALFGAYDALWWMSESGGGFVGDVLEQATSASARHDYGPIRGTIDPFGQPVLVYGDARAASIFGPATAPTCLYRLADTDADAIPDAVEPTLGTDPSRADTDGDGQSDGQEVLLLGTDPTTPDGCTPSPEVCDALDNDCDGEVDEALEQACYPGPANTRGVGLCHAGTQLCGAGAWGACQGAVTPAASDATCDARDEDCDGAVDDNYVRRVTRCGVGACAAVGMTACVAGRVQDSCAPRAPAVDDATCNGVDDDCNGAVDEEATPTPVRCGTGACAAEGEVVCSAGAPVDTCRPGVGAADDTTCDGVDDDCNGQTDEDFNATPTQCGAGACTAAGTTRCVAGVVVDTCRAIAASPDDATCDGVDDDCDGDTDEDFTTRPTTCGLGVCAAAGQRACVAGRVIDDCRPDAPTGDDTTCDGLDDDCDGVADDGFVRVPTTCGVGLCRAAGEVTCVDGRRAETCTPLPAADVADVRCDGQDEDCDGAVDDDVSPTESECGLGVCARTAETLCVDGATVDPCEPGEPTGADADCNGLDDDCDGAADDGFVPERTTCGQGACAREVVVQCVAGARVGVCRPGEPAGDDATCDGVDDDCDGETDEDFAPTFETCGVGVCASSGQILCVGGATASTCVAGPPARGDDPTCDGVDDDCDGPVDEDFAAAPTACGVGACVATGVSVCREGRVVDTCAPAAGAPDDSTCDGIDDDCDGAVDDDFLSRPTRCGAGVCAATGQETCVAGRRVDDCRASAPPVPRDRSCNGVDDDCDGQVDEDYRGAFTACGVGDCTARGLMVCRNGAESNLCTPGRPAAADATCDGRDNDCDGRTDEDFVPAATTCGAGPCAATGHSTCAGGQLADDCAPGAPLGDDTTCDAVDDDCDGVADDAFVGAVVGCGAGACAAEAREQCVAGEVVSACAPGGGAADDTTCDGVDDDCDGETDEDFAPVEIICGQGACVATGQRTCAGGATVDICRPAAPTGDDSDCDGVDDDCDGRPDDAFLGAPVSCGEGACRAEGREVCVAGQVVADCAAGAPGGDDSDCDGLDDDCDGEIDEAFAPAASTCGVGACARAGLRVCDRGVTVDDCTPGAPAADDATCDGLDDDCDGATDENFAPTPVACAPGACAAVGERRCFGGDLVDTCDQPSAATDTTCDGVDDDCNGRVDDGFVGGAVECGVGVCVRVGETRCVAARVESACVPGAPAPADATCDGLDDDCDGRVDDDVSPTPTSCGVGACAAAGALRCVAGAPVDTCAPGSPASADDATCDGVDDDCDGATDEDFVGAEVSCGVGACAAVGDTRCVAGRVVESCRAAAPASPVDNTCDAVDDDCDGRVDDDFVGAATHCGVGACRAIGRERCVAGVQTAACQPGAPAANDATCNGLDDDCDGQIDEDFAPTPSRCGVGACEARGETRCAAGRLVDTCVAGPAAPWDSTCDRVDDDCDGRVDDDVAPVAVTCGEGLCAAEGQRVCELGRLVEHCRPLAPAADDDCDGRDQDCDGTADDDFVPETILCGEGACGAMGTRDCVAGRSVDTCRPGAPAADDHTCDALDDDCDGEDDEDAPRAASRCGVGACAAVGEVRCVAGGFVDTCSPGAPAADDTTCDGRDDDCDGLADEDCAPVKADAAYPPAPDAAVVEPDAAVAPADAGTDAEDTTDADAPTGDASTALDAFAVTTIPDMETPPEPESDAYLIPVPDMLTLEVDATPPPVVSCDCRASGGAGDRAAWGLLLLLLGGLRRPVSARRGSSPRA